MQQVEKMLASEVVIAALDGTSESWLRYFDGLRTLAPDYELKLALDNEFEKLTATTQQINKMILAANLAQENICYCNKTGQPLGVLINGGTNASIASQWLMTGDKALQKHSDDEPIAFTVYLFGEFLRKAYPSDIAGLSKQLAAKTTLYHMLVNPDGLHRTSVVLLMQYAMRLLGANELVSDQMRTSFYNQLTRALDASVITNGFATHDFRNRLVAWASSILGHVYKDMVVNIETVDQFEEFEGKLHKIEVNLTNAYNAKYAGTVADQLREASNRVGAKFTAKKAKPRNASMMNAAKKEKDTSAMVGLLGDIFANINADASK